MRRVASVDTNQKEIVFAFRQLGATVQPLHTIGKGCPDLVVGVHGLNFLVEVKDGSKSPSKQKLTADEKDWHDGWRGDVVVITSVKECAALIERAGLICDAIARGTTAT